MSLEKKMPWQVHLVGQKIDRIEKVHDYWMVSFTEATLCIFNKCDISIRHSNLTGESFFQVEDVCVDDKHILIIISPESYIDISLDDSAYFGPESFSLKFKDGASIIGD